ncbi:putative cytochrome b561 [Candidatus Glomeribacter gigasporarum BEG34]|uniref:Putative cytochrome b561 n=1 Tax=Candidatus Glomeribacter gigasporarum BEG34 TaxID=1070319 RepID=G2JBI0_9BURK|nr:cytochrome b [Candidatus Glomeribacter gigasporarum]CCD30134.1 putative cytochrome b561 [Candidatus Glomeribacter gigasporarum BEG34]
MTHIQSLAVHEKKYTAPAIALHWLIAALIICGFSLGWVMTGIPGFPPFKLQYYTWHKWIGVTIFVFAVLRVLWRLTHPAPPLQSTVAPWQRRVAYFTHALLYLLMLAIPLSGYLMSLAAGKPVVYLNLIPLPLLIEPNKALAPLFRTAHLYLNNLLLGLVALHVLAVLKHQFVDRDGLLTRMLPTLRAPSSPYPHRIARQAVQNK